MTEVIMNVLTVYERKTLYPGDKIDVPISVEQRWINRGLAHYPVIREFKVSKKPIGKLKKCKPTTIIIPVHDCLDYLRICLNSLEKYTNNYELIIVDNGSDRETKTYIGAYNVITNKENKGYGYACNQGIKTARYGFLCFLNSDTILAPDWLYELQKCFTVKKDCGIVSPSTSFSGGEQCDKSLMPKRFSMSEDDIVEYSKELKRGYKISDIFGFCMLTKKNILSKVGVFDWKRYGIGNSEEKDLMWRLEQVGYKNYWAKGSYVHHYGHKTFDRLKIEPLESVMKNRQIFAERKKDRNLFIENDATVELKKSNKVSVIIPTYNRKEETVKTLESLFKNNKNIDVLIIDNGSDDLSYLKNFKVNIITNRKNLGTVKAINQGLGFCKSEYIVIMHNDLVVENEGWIDKAVKFLTDNQKAGMVGVSGWQAVRENGMPDWGTLRTALDKYDIDCNRKPKDFDEVSVLDGSCNVIRNMGLKLDEIYGLMHFYDLDLSMQYRQRGYKLFAFRGNAQHFAEDPDKSTRADKNYLEQIGMEDTQYYEKNRKLFAKKWRKYLPIISP